MAVYNQDRYRYINWTGAEILEASELDRLQRNIRGVGNDDITQWTWDLGAVYAEGTTFNVTPVIVGTTVSLTPTLAGHPMLVFVRGRWEILQSGEAPSVTLAAGGNIYLNWELVIRDN